MFALSILCPLGLAGLALAVPSNRWRPWLLPLAAAANLVLTAGILRRAGTFRGAGWVALDPAGALVLGLLAVLFGVCSFYTVGYLGHRQERSNRVFCACLLAFLSLANLVAWSRHLALLWVALEATTLAAAPLIYFNRNRRSIEATWKYLLVCSVGIALALLGSFFLAYACLHGGLAPSLHLGDLLAHAPRLSKPWLHGAFVLLLVGYGTKMGLAPLHTWKPDAYGEAPGVVGALLAGGMTSLAFLAVFRAFQVCAAAGEAAYARGMLLALGLFSMAAAGVFVVRQRDIKRLLAYSSVEHMGVLALGLGIGGAATAGAFLHLVNNALAKGLLFLCAGNIHRAYGAKTTDEVAGAARRLPLSGWLFLLGLLAATGSPPFGPFQSLFAIGRAALEAGRPWVAGSFGFFLLVVFTGMGATVLAVVQGPPSPAARSTAYRDGLLTGAPLLVFFGLVLLLGLWLPPPLADLLRQAAELVEGAG
ncbi:MAG: proton-conducting transporter membrane subunit [Thermodesulfobacteriota bacterium]